MSGETSGKPDKIDVTVKQMDAETWRLSGEIAKAMQQSRAVWLGRAILELAAIDRGQPRVTMPDERGNSPPVTPQVTRQEGVTLAIADPQAAALAVAALMQGNAAMATAAGRKVSRRVIGHANAVSENILRAMRGMPLLPPRGFGRARLGVTVEGVGVTRPSFGETG